MASCDGRFLLFLSFFTNLAPLFVVLCADYKQLQVFDSDRLKEKIQRSRHHPVCVLLRKEADDSKLEDIVTALVTSDHKTGEKQFYQWHFGSFAFEKVALPPVHRPAAFPELRCYTGKNLYMTYEGRHSKPAVGKWLDKLVQRRAGMLDEATVAAVEVAQHQYQFVIIAFPSAARHVDIEDMVFKEKEIMSNATAYIVHEDAEDFKTFRAKFQIKDLPAVVVLHQHDGSHLDVPTVKVLSGGTLAQKSLGVYLQARRMAVPHYNLADFVSSVIMTEVDYVPILVSYYSQHAEHIQSYLTLLRHSVEEFSHLNIRIRFGLVDMQNPDSRKILHRWVNAKFSRSFPMAVLYYQDETGQIAHVKVEETRLTPYNLHEILAETVGFVDGEGDVVPYHPQGIYNPYEISGVFEGPHGTQCSLWSHNMTDNNPVRTVWQRKKATKVRVQKEEEKLWHDKFGTEAVNEKLEKVEGIPVLTGRFWSEVIEKSHAPQHPLQGGNEWAGEVTKVALVVFVMAECRSCKNAMPEFTKLQESVKYIEGGSMYLVNCSVDQALCLYHDIRGYPTVAAFRGLGWLHSQRCLRDPEENHYTNYVRLDFHGVLLHDAIIDWFSRASSPAITDHMVDWPDGKTDDVSLFGVLMPRRSDFLPIPPQRSTQYYYPYPCFRLACELLYAKVHCHSVYSRDVPAREFDSDDLDLIISKVILKRRDGASAVIMKLGTSLEETIADESDTNLHKFHKPHRYKLKPHTRCEQDHGACTDLIIAYTMDHCRLPITPLSSDLFHVHSTERLKESLPILMALVHRGNLTKDSHFLQELMGVAYEMYSKLEVVSVNVDEYRSWAMRFVPEGYAMTVAVDGKDPLEMYVYPRICFVKRDNHRRVAFYPTPGTAQTNQKWYWKENLINYVKMFLSHPDKLMGLETNVCAGLCSAYRYSYATDEHDNVMLKRANQNLQRDER